MQIADFFRYVAPHLPGCPDETMRIAVIEAVKVLCNRAHIWRETQGPIELLDGLSDYEPDVPLGAQLVNVDIVWCDGRQLRAETPQSMTDWAGDYRNSKSSEPVSFIGNDERGIISVFPVPHEPTKSLTLRAEYEPQMGAIELPDAIMKRYHTALTHGVKAECMLFPGTTWSNPQMAEYWRTRFDEAVSEATINMLHGNVGGSIRVRPRRFG